MKAYQITFLYVNYAGYEGEESVVTLANSVANAHDKADGKLKVLKNGRKRKSIKAVVEIGEAL